MSPEPTYAIVCHLRGAVEFHTIEELASMNASRIRSGIAPKYHPVAFVQGLQAAQASRDIWAKALKESHPPTPEKDT